MVLWAEAPARVEEFHPDVTLVDIELGEENGFDLARQLAAAPGAGKILANTTRF